MSLGPQKPLVSVIVPIYKTERYLDTCLTSICSQSLDNIEILCVDDSSPDASSTIVKDFAKKDDRVRLITHERNLGLGGARNTGIRTAKAEYIASVDSDDYVDGNFLKSLYDATSFDAEPVDLVACGFRQINTIGEELSRRVQKPGTIINDKNSINIFRHFKPSFCNKLWRKSIFLKNDIWFPNHTFFEDLATTPRFLACSTLIKCIADVNYNYVRRDTSITRTYSEKHLIDYLRVFSILKEFLLSRGLYGRYQQEFWDTFNGAMRFHSKNVFNGDSRLDEKEAYLRELLMLKWAFSGYHDLTRLMPAKELLQHLESTTVRSSLVPKQKMDSPPILFQRFRRQNLIQRFFKYVSNWKRSF